jgi:lipoprotein-anchoring transpeptidase ErfK/SrfK
MMRRRELNRDPDSGYANPDDDIPYRPRPYRDGRPLNEYPNDSSEAPDYSYPEAPQQEAFPEAPQAYPAEPGGPEIVAREPIERRPLGDPTIENGSKDSGTGAGATQPGVAFGVRDDVAALQVLLDRKGASPGVIDGRFGSNVDKALAAYRDITGENLHSTDMEKIKADLAASGGDAFTQYTITPEDAAGPYVASVPEDYSAKAKLDRLGYTSVAEMLAERFHMDEGYLKSLNPGANFGRPGTVIKVVNTGKEVSTPVARIIADKGNKQVRAYDAAGKLVAAYPATIGSSDTPSPTGTHAVSRVAFDPEYTYNPNLNFKQGENDNILRIPPGPNGPVGSIWIALDKPTYGIHGTPDPSKIGKTESHGCVRLTNWDAAELAKLVKPGVPVEFVD